LRAKRISVLFLLFVALSCSKGNTTDEAYYSFPEYGLQLFVPNGWYPQDAKEYIINTVPGVDPKKVEKLSYHEASEKAGFLFLLTRRPPEIKGREPAAIGFTVFELSHEEINLPIDSLGKIRRTQVLNIYQQDSVTSPIKVIHIGEFPAVEWEANGIPAQGVPVHIISYSILNGGTEYFIYAFAPIDNFEEYRGTIDEFVRKIKVKSREN